MDIVGFLEGKTPDNRGRMLSMLWKQTDDDAENNHDYIQWMFPLDEPSQAVNGAPVLSDFDIDEIRENQLVTENLEESARWFLGFLERNEIFCNSSRSLFDQLDCSCGLHHVRHHD